jgi:hypothetical protein
MMAAAIPPLAAQTRASNLVGIEPVDRECWRTEPDYSSATISAWRGMGLGLDVPRKPEDPKWEIWLEFNRQRFRDCVRKRVELFQKESPGTRIAFNNLYTSRVPEKPELPVDYLISDTSNHLRLDTRYLAQTGKSWGYKPSNTQDAAAVLAQGGLPIENDAEISRFCQERQSMCQNSQSLSEVAVLFSRTSLYRKSNQLFGNWGRHIDPCTALLDALIQCHCSVDVMPDWAPLTWPVLAIPEWEEIGDALAREIADQVRGGLKLILIGAANARKFKTLLGLKLDLSPEATMHEIGKGRVVWAPQPASASVKQCLESLGPVQISIKDSNTALELVIRKQDQRTILHFINLTKSLAGQQVRLKRPISPKKISWEPSGRPVQFNWREGYLTFETPPIPLHSMAVID